MCPIHRRLVRGCWVKAARETSVHSRLIRTSQIARVMLLVLACTLAAVAAAPSYDQRQEGDFNVRADVQNVVFVVAIPQKLSSGMFDGLFKSVKQIQNQDIEDRADTQVMKAFVEPSKPYGVEIGSVGDSLSSADGRTVEVVISGRRRLESEIEPEKEEYKLIGATEQCGPDRERDPETLMCRFPKDKRSTKEPEVVPVSS